MRSSGCYGCHSMAVVWHERLAGSCIFRSDQLWLLPPGTTMHYSRHHLPSSLSHLSTTSRLITISLFQNFLFVQNQLFRLQGTSSKSVPKGSKTWEPLAWNTPFFAHCQWQSVMRHTRAIPHHDMPCHDMSCHVMICHVMSCHVLTDDVMFGTLCGVSNLINRPLQLGWNGCDTETLVKVIFMQGITWQNKSAVWVQNIFYFMKNIQTTVGLRHLQKGKVNKRKP